MVEVNFKFPFVHRHREMDIAHGPGYRKEEKGDISPVRRWTDRLPHPVNMGNYDKWANDPEANIAFNVLTDIIAGVGFYTEMPQGQENHRNKKIIDDYCEKVNADEDFQEITMTMLQKGFCPTERLGNYDLKILPPETFYIYKNKKGKILKYTQERSQGEVINEWTGKQMDDIILFFHRRTTSWPYGKSLTESIGNLLDEREQMNEDMPKAVHRWAYPIPIMQTSRGRATLQKAVEDRDIDDWVFIGNVQEGEVRWDTIAIDPQARFIPYIELIYYQICEGLHAPLLLYLKNATEASATVMMESVDRLVNGIQRYIKRRVERYLFEPQVGEPVPRLVWGQPKTGLEEITLSDIATLYSSGSIKFNQVQDLLRKMGLDLIEPEFPKEPQQLPFQQIKPAPQIPMEKLLDKLNDLQTNLNVIETNFKEKRISLVDAVRLGEKAINVHVKQLHPKNQLAYQEERNLEFDKWIKRLTGMKKPQEWRVIPPTPE